MFEAARDKKFRKLSEIPEIFLLLGRAFYGQLFPGGGCERDENF